MLFRSAAFATVLVTALTIFSTVSPPTAEAHSWAACIKWVFNKPTESGGRCLGTARRFPYKSKKGFAGLDHDDPSRHYRQTNPADKALPCSDKKTGLEKGADETRASPPSKAYGGSFGPMTLTKVGEQLCLRWPGKNHAESNEKDHGVQIYLTSSPNSKDPTQEELFDHKVADLPYKNCGKGTDSNDRPCGGCFTVPQRAAGTYLLQWRWMLNKDEWYTSCADIEVV
ncbi:hypothetical protein BGW38_000525 [Lunasporangiospora selenospora]|uniref:Chitin-binding type-4 domain-containing protein n=1 Tax=Lunasporangiospora selenospora TaxID=979761 RepID=A0A9P6FVD8_9FUNG|nr:hypothetical protein BGW38_000525 [Lunasporangiospora selenospora]